MSNDGVRDKAREINHDIPRDVKTEVQGTSHLFCNLSRLKCCDAWVPSKNLPTVVVQTCKTGPSEDHKFTIPTQWMKQHSTDSGFSTATMFWRLRTTTQATWNDEKLTETQTNSMTPIQRRQWASMRTNHVDEPKLSDIFYSGSTDFLTIGSPESGS